MKQNYVILTDSSCDLPAELARQLEIVEILDKFRELECELEHELEHELELRRKQYEYYRDMLLSFPERKENA